jgi:ribosomal protein S27AE
MQKQHCQKCQSTKIISNVQIFDQGQYSDGNLKIIFHENPDALLFKGSHTGILKAWICGDCGYTELYLENPQELYLKYQEFQNKG